MTTAQLTLLLLVTFFVGLALGAGFAMAIVRGAS